MSNRRRISRQARGYAARVQRRSARLPRRPGRPGGWRPSAGWLPPGLAVLAEAGHLTAAYLAWPGSSGTGAYHVVVGAVLGWFAAMVLTGETGRQLLVAGVAVAGLGPLLWLAGLLFAGSPYQHLPAAVVAGIVAADTVLAGLLVPAAWRVGPAAQLRSQ
ncbi:MAG TPA: hypothetical protein VIL37_16210 [Natronosporangium sp.]